MIQTELKGSLSLVIMLERWTPRVNGSLGFRIIGAVGRHGVFVAKVHPTMPAARNGLVVGDHIIQIDSK